ncbi:MAG: (Fe-S)-binding protein [bacterium]
MNWNIPDLKELEDKIWRCTACGTCKVAYSFGPPTTCADICPAGVELGFEGYMSSKGKIAFARGLLSGELPWDEPLLDAIYRCTVCAGCQNQCQLDHKPFIPEIIEAMRRKAVRDGVGPMPAHRRLVQSMRSYDNPYQGPRRSRTDWTRPFRKAGKRIKDLNREPAGVLLFVGCTGAYNAAARPIPAATASILLKLGVDFGILGEKELCCGSTAMRIGEDREFRRVAESNLETFGRLRREKGVHTIVTSCAGCYRAIRRDYALASGYQEALGDIAVLHTVDFLHGLSRAGRLSFPGGVASKVTYHDPCHTGRHLTRFTVDEEGTRLWKGAYVESNEGECLYEQPRELLQAIPGLELVEMERVRANSYCCGGGGGVMTGYADWAARNASERVREGMRTGADLMATICPFCHHNLSEGSRRIESPLRVVDLVELIDRALPE